METRSRQVKAGQSRSGKGLKVRKRGRLVCNGQDWLKRCDISGTEGSKLKAGHRSREVKGQRRSREVRKRIARVEKGTECSEVVRIG